MSECDARTGGRLAQSDRFHKPDSRGIAPGKGLIREHFKTAFAYDHWANLRTAEMVAKTPGVEAYTNSRGEAFETPIEEILRHVAFHGGYHRGQVAAAVRAAGGTPINTDYIVYYRGR